ncbi:Arc/MetJ-type ribon-helix-helix transcriptional regulator [Catenuloplanes nepalensis]|uniref:Arc/MetJ-type ribon-helix-helix transcriptional regulator n=1 Tax=Catenuloplanes nepalensis TaxID=587533 RepID=A0ABT9MWW8_9ACTN|nr:hypothetical protein [Catenuloplanes nepalensis]MDP9795889.1 Arc/MetJ-type ribon-helix-helix transcriptional regulator [Catenuloplanes nepalensis]
MTVKMTVSVPDDVAEFLRDSGNASAAVTEAVRPLLADARRARQRAAAQAMAEWQRSRPAADVENDTALIEASNDAALAGAEW